MTSPAPTCPRPSLLVSTRLSAGTSLLFGLLLLSGCGKWPDQEARATAPAKATAVSPLFEDITQKSGIHFVHQLANGKLDNIIKSDGAGGVFLDFDNDGLMDVYLVNSGPTPVISEAPEGTPRLSNRLYRNRGDGTFEDVTEKAGLAGRGFGITAAAADYDNDGYTDLLVVNFGEIILYHNEHNGTFKEVTREAGLAGKYSGISATWADVDGDGHLDLFLANYLVFDPSLKPPAGSNVPYPGPTTYESEFNVLFRNRGDGTFEDISEKAGIRIPGHRAMSVSPLDFNGDGNIDFYISNDGTPNLLLAGDGNGHFEEVALQSGVAFDQFGQAAGSMGAALGDLNDDGLTDLLVTRFGKPSLYINSAGGMFEDRIGPAGILAIEDKYTGWGANFIDYDNAGKLDLVIVNGDSHFLDKLTPSLLLENNGNGVFTSVPDKGGAFFKRQLNLRGCGLFDLDNDGRQDLLMTALGGPAILLHNQAKQSGHWLEVKLVGTKSNRDGFGAKVKITVGAKTYYRQANCPTGYVFQQDPRLHFGLGQATKIDRIEIQWPKPGGQTQVLTDVPADQILRVQEP